MRFETRYIAPGAGGPFPRRAGAAIGVFLAAVATGCVSSIEMEPPPTARTAAWHSDSARGRASSGDGHAHAAQALPLPQNSYDYGSLLESPGIAPIVGIEDAGVEGALAGFPPGAAAVTAPHQVILRTIGLHEHGIASWYAEGWAWRKTASGEIYNPNSFTAAHRELPFNCIVLVRNLDNGRAVYVRINNRGPFIKGRIIDLSPAAAQAIGIYRDGLANVEIARVR